MQGTEWKYTANDTLEYECFQINYVQIYNGIGA